MEEKEISKTLIFGLIFGLNRKLKDIIGLKCDHTSLLSDLLFPFNNKSDNDLFNLEHMKNISKENDELYEKLLILSLRDINILKLVIYISKYKTLINNCLLNYIDTGKAEIIPGEIANFINDNLSLKNEKV